MGCRQPRSLAQCAMQHEMSDVNWDQYGESSGIARGEIQYNYKDATRWENLCNKCKTRRSSGNQTNPQSHLLGCEKSLMCILETWPSQPIMRRLILWWVGGFCEKVRKAVLFLSVCWLFRIADPRVSPSAAGQQPQAITTVGIKPKLINSTSPIIVLDPSKLYIAIIVF